VFLKTEKRNAFGRYVYSSEERLPPLHYSVLNDFSNDPANIRDIT
jgi:hypothetical protein